VSEGGILRFVRDVVLEERGAAIEGAPSAPVSLFLNESHSEIPRALKDRIRDRLDTLDWHRYPDQDPARWQALLASHTGWRADGILIGNGINELLGVLVRTVLGPGERVILPVPTFSFYGLQLRLSGAEIIEVPARADMAFDVDRLVEEAQNARLVLLGSPSNPGGTRLPKEGLARLLETGALVIVDEAYVDYTEQDFVPYLGETSPLILLRSFSKAWSAASMRCGYVLAPPALRDQMAKLVLPYNISAWTLAAMEVLIEDPSWIVERIRHVQDERARLNRAITDLGAAITSTETNFVLMQAPDGDAGRLQVALESKGVLVKNLAPAVPGHLRVTIGTRQENDQFLSALSQVFDRTRANGRSGKKPPVNGSR